MPKRKKSKLTFLIIIIVIIILLLLGVVFIRNLIIPALFLFCLIFMVKYGQFILLDLDPTPFCAFVVYYIYNLNSALYFGAIAIPLIDFLANRFNHFTLINTASAITTILLFWILSIPRIIIFGILVFNLIRIIVALLLRLEPETILYSIIHAAVYFMIGSVIGFFVYPIY